MRMMFTNCAMVAGEIACSNSSLLSVSKVVNMDSANRSCSSVEQACWMNTSIHLAAYSWFWRFAFEMYVRMLYTSWHVRTMGEC